MFKADGEMERFGRDNWWNGVFQIVVAFGAFDISYLLYKWLAKSVAKSGNAVDIINAFAKEYSEATTDDDKLKIFLKYRDQLLSIPQVVSALNSSAQQVASLPNTMGAPVSYQPLSQPLVLA